MDEVVTPHRAGAHNGEVDLVHVYLSEIGRQPLQERDEEVRRAQAIERGSRAEQELAAGGRRIARLHSRVGITRPVCVCRPVKDS